MCEISLIINHEHVFLAGSTAPKLTCPNQGSAFAGSSDGETEMLIDYRPHSASSTSFNTKTSQKQPLLAGVRSIQSIHDLAPFFSHISIASYEALYACRTNVDWDNVEAGLLEQLFDGR